MAQKSTRKANASTSPDMRKLRNKDRNMRNISELSKSHQGVMSLMSLMSLMFLRFSSHGCLLIPRCPERAEPQTRDDLLSLSPRENVPTKRVQMVEDVEDVEDVEFFKIFKSLGMPPDSPISISMLHV
jgi:hypothetical protein